MLKQINLEEANLVSHKQTKFYLPLHFYDSVTLSTYLVRYALKKSRGLFGNFSQVADPPPPPPFGNPLN